MSCPIRAKFYVWTQIPRIFSKTKKQLSFRGKNVVSIFSSRRFLFKYFLCMLIGIKILSSVSLESLFPVKHNHFVWWLIWQWSIEWGPQCQRGGTKLCHTDIFPYNSFFFFFQKAHRSIDGVPFIQVHQTMSTYKLSRNLLKSALSYH